LYKKVNKILFDTSFLIQIIELYSIDRFIENFRGYEFYIPVSVYKEIKKLAYGDKPSKYMKTKILISIIKKYKFNIIPSKTYKVDEDIIKIALEGEYIIATGDREIRRLAKSHGIKVLYFRDNYPYID